MKFLKYIRVVVLLNIAVCCKVFSSYFIAKYCFPLLLPCFFLRNAYRFFLFFSFFGLIRYISVALTFLEKLRILFNTDFCFHFFLLFHMEVVIYLNNIMFSRTPVTIVNFFKIYALHLSLKSFDVNRLSSVS